MTKRGATSAVWGRRAFWLSVVVLVAIQQYPGFWESKTLVLDFLPAPLFYQVVVTLLAVALWWVGTLVAWPDDGQSETTETTEMTAGGEMAPREDGS